MEALNHSEVVISLNFQRSMTCKIENLITVSTRIRDWNIVNITIWPYDWSINEDFRFDTLTG